MNNLTEELMHNEPLPSQISSSRASGLSFTFAERKRSTKRYVLRQADTKGLLTTAIHTHCNLCLLLQNEQNVKVGEGASEKQEDAINNGTCLFLHLGSAFAYLYVLFILEKQAEIGGRVVSVTILY